MNDLGSSRAVLLALQGLQDKVRCLENERAQAAEEVQRLKGELTRRQEDFKHTQELQILTIQEEHEASRLSYGKLLADKRAVDIRLDEADGLKWELQESSETAHDRAQDARVAQLAAEAKASILEERAKECERLARVKKDRSSRARKIIRRESDMADSQLTTLAGRVEMLQRTLQDERASRKAAEDKHRRAQISTVRTRRYLDSILDINQELVARTAGTFSSPTPTARQSVRRVPGELHRQPNNERNYSISGVNPVLKGEGIDVRAAVQEACALRRAGGDPIPSLTALYERIGFCAIQGEGTPSLPTSPSRAIVGKTFERCGSHDIDEEHDRDYRPAFEEPTGVGGFIVDGNTEVLSSSKEQNGRGGSSPDNGRKDHGTGKLCGIGGSTGGYSFANSPIASMTSSAGRSPAVLQRLEALSSQLERERADLEQWYKSVVHRASHCAQGEGAGADLDPRSLTNAIALLQEKSQQLEIVREGLIALKASLQAPTIASPTLYRRKVAALKVLQGLCHGVAGGETGNLSAA